MIESPKSTLEAILFSAQSPLSLQELKALLPEGTDVHSLLVDLANDYDDRGVMVSVGRRGYALRSRPEASDLANMVVPPSPKLTRAALETLVAIATFDASGNPLTRSEIERVRGVSLSPGILDALLAAGYVKPGRRRDTPGRPLTWNVTDEFYEAYGLRSLGELPSYVSMLEGGLTKLVPLMGDMEGADEDAIEQPEAMSAPVGADAGDEDEGFDEDPDFDEVYGGALG